MMEGTPAPQPPRAAVAKCPVCQCPIHPGEATLACPECRTTHHTDCWQENQGCGVYGCSYVPPTEKRSDLEIAPSYWGKEEKACPSCGREIKAAAVRCLHCGAMFSSASPQDRRSFTQEQDFRQRRPHLERNVWLLFVFSLLPCTAPFAGVVALFWNRARREDLAKLPAIYSALARLAAIVGLAQLALVVMLAVIYPFVGQ